MDSVNHIESHDQFAKTYDSQVKQYKSYGHEVLFGMCYEYIKPGESLLDLGIGTGLSSIHFANAGLTITGLDGSAEMLKECRKKDFAKDLRQYNILDVPYPFKDGIFSHVICCGVFHFFDELMPVIKEAGRLLNPGGIFAFTVASPSENNESLVVNEQDTAWGISIYQHPDGLIYKAAKDHGFEIEKEQKVLTKNGDDKSDDLLFKVFVLRKK